VNSIKLVYSTILGYTCPIIVMVKLSLSIVALIPLVSSVSAQSPVWGQCTYHLKTIGAATYFLLYLGGGIGWSGSTTCASGSSCVVSNAYYSQCIPASLKPFFKVPFIMISGFNGWWFNQWRLYRRRINRQRFDWWLQFN